jgi:hypothetical protein
VIVMKFSEAKPAAGPETQAAPSAHSGGTGGQGDFSKTAQRSRARKDRQSDGLKEDRSEHGGPLKAGGAS